MNEEEFLAKLREAFAVEAEEHLQAMTAGLLELEKGAPEARRHEIVETIYREAHSLKGAARAVSRADIESICQALESVFATWKTSAPQIAPETFDSISAALDLVASLRTHAVPPGTLQEAVRRISEATSSTPAQPAATPAPPPEILKPPAPAAAPPAPEPEHAVVAESVRVPLSKMDSLLLQAEEMLSVKLTAGQHTSDLRDLGTTLGVWRKEWQKVRTTVRPGTAGGDSSSPEKLVEFLNWNESQLSALDKQLTALTKAAAAHERAVATMIDDLLDDAKRLVMLPFAWLLDPLPKQVRDLAREQEKEIELAIHGSDVEIDKRILEEMKAPLNHLVRNAIDHGVETPAARTKRGKSRNGTLSIHISQTEGNKVQILVSDDGEGIDLARVRASAVKNAIISKADASHLSDEATIALIFQSGVSTSPIVTEISGRGLGMAIVREKVEKLGGEIAIETEPQVRTSFRITLPLTLATFKGILVEAGGQTFVIPTSSVERIKRILREDIKTVENRDTIAHEGHSLSLAHLADVLGLARREPKEPSPFLETLVLGVANQHVAFVVEAVSAEREVLVKEIGKPLIRVRNIASATVLGSGPPVLILNAADLLKSAIHLSATGRPLQPRTETKKADTRPRNLLVADDSVTSRMLLKNILESAGYHVTTAVDGMDALTTVQGSDFDLVVSDVEMPRMDGFELTGRIRADKRTAEIPVVLVTALASREHKERGIDVGASAYIVKSSFDQSNLLEIVRKLL
jgi:two-component system chemotaxis sensor kinase CheA